MSTKNIFGPSTNAYIGLPDNAVYAWIKIGNDSPNKCLITAEAGGVQNFRTQYDIAVDGSEYLLTAGRGGGGFTFRVYEGPFCAPDSGKNGFTHFADKYGKLDNYDSRKIEVVMSLEPGTNAAKSTKNAAKYRGIIIAATTMQTRMNDGSVTIITDVKAEGMWQ